MSNTREKLAKQNRADLTMEERQVEALERIADSLGNIQRELVAIRNNTKGLNSEYKRPAS